MAILTHGSDMSLSGALRPFVHASGGTVRGALAAMAEAGLEAVQLDIALSGVRPRELDQRARKDLLALVGRRGLRLSGLDLFIPREHFTQPAHLDRAVAAVLAGIDLAADLGRVPLSIALPPGDVDAEVTQTIAEAVDGRGVRLAVHAEDQVEALAAWLASVNLDAIGAGLDPASVLADGGDPSGAVQQLADRLAVARLTDYAPDGGTSGRRVAPGKGRLDVMAYRVSVDLAQRRAGPVVLDLKGVAGPAVAAAELARRTWSDASISL